MSVNILWLRPAASAGPSSADVQSLKDAELEALWRRRVAANVERRRIKKLLAEQQQLPALLKQQWG